MKSILISIRPQWVEKIVKGEKTIEVRKSAPKETPFKAYIYETKGKKIECGFHIEDTGITLREPIVFGMHKAKIVKHYRYKGKGRVIGEFVCNTVDEYAYDYCDGVDIDDDTILETAIDREDINIYAKGKPLYGLHISNLKIYDKPKALSEFKTPPCEKSEKACGKCKWLVKINTPDVYECECYVEDGKPITRPPENYMYVKEYENEQTKIDETKNG